MNEQIENCLHQSGLTAQGCWDELDDYAKQAIEKFAELIVRECIEQLVEEANAWEAFSRKPQQGQETNASAALFAAYRLKEDAVSRLEEHFGVE